MYRSFVGIDVAKARNAIAVADGERGGEVRFIGEVDASEESMRRAVKRIAAEYDRAHFCYEAGPTGYGLHRLITSLGHSCTVVAPSLIPRKPGDRVKTNRRDAIGLAKLFGPANSPQCGCPTRATRQCVIWFALALRRSRPYGFTANRSARSCSSTAASSRGRRPGADAICDGCRSRNSIIRPIRLSCRRSWTRCGTRRSGCTARSNDRGVRIHMVAGAGRPGACRHCAVSTSIVAVTFATEIGDLRRFESPRQLMGYLGLVPSERSTGETVRAWHHQGGNGRVRHMLVESAWTYRHPPRIGKMKLYRLEQTSPKVREIAWKAQTRLTTRYRALSARGKKTTVICTAIARELVGFMWSVGREAQPV